MALQTALQMLIEMKNLASTPYSINRLSSELFRKIQGAFVDVCETISGGIWQVLRGKIKETYPEQNKEEIRKNILDTIKTFSKFKLALNSIFNEQGVIWGVYFGKVRGYSETT